uniref:NADH-ubiquinone oxidoreductase chain 6 n=1 Tax=Pyrrhidium sanguineum TaxID=1323404 RepID=A0A343C3K7_9CUCU|nr:NADH dehydrogenase subunit 6 [Pyrrhidium sanguineum]
MMILLILMIMTTALFIFLDHPLSFGLILLLKTILISMITGMMNLNFWFSYILFMVMVGGMLILFIYMTSVASNEKFKFSYNLFLGSMAFLLVSIIMISFDQFFFDINSLNFELSSMMNPNMSLSMSKYINPPLNKLMYLTIIYLLITLIMVVKVTEINRGPLRQVF